MKKILLAISVVAVLVLASVAVIKAATEEKIEDSIATGVTWLVAQQNADGSWGDSENGDGKDGGNKVAKTGFAVVKLEDRAIELGYESPFDPAYEYVGNVEKGLNYIFANANTIAISVQPAGNPDTNGNGIGVYFGGRRIYETGIAMMAVAASRSPGKVVNVPGSAVDGQTYKQVLQDAVDYFAFGQNDYPSGQGGWGYEENSQWQQCKGDGRVLQEPVEPVEPCKPGEPCGEPCEPGEWYSRSDNSNSGYVVLGLRYAGAYGFNCTVPQFVKDELSVWIDYVQNDVDGDIDDGGSGYSDPSWVNLLKTGNLLFEMEFVGDTLATSKVQDAIAYIERHWNDANWDSGWKGPGIQWECKPEFCQGVCDPVKGCWTECCKEVQVVRPHYQAAYCLMKGLESFGIDTINIGGSDIDWFGEMSSAIVSTQNVDGSWPWDQWGDQMLATEWALLTLERVVPPLEVVIDIKPGSYPNSIDLNSNGVIPVAILTTSATVGEPKTFDAATVNSGTVRFGPNGAIAVQWALEDVDNDSDIDMILHFKTQETGIRASDTEAVLTGQTTGGRDIVGTDSVRIVLSGSKGKK